VIEKLARWSYRRRWLVLIGWLVVLIGASTAMQSATYSRDFEAPGESQQTLDLLTDRFPAGESSDGVDVVFQADAGVQDPAVRQRVDTLLRQAQDLDHVVGALSPYDAESSGRVSPDGSVAFATLQLDVSGFDVPPALIDDLKALTEQARGPGLAVELGGQAVRNAETDPGGIAEVVGFVVAAIILLIAFGSVVSAALPIVTALFALGLGMSGIAILTRVTDIPEFAPQLAGMIGIGVGIDYALFIVTRYREALKAGHAPDDATAVAMGTAGRAILVAGGTVVVSLLGVLVFGDEALRGLGIAAAVVVLTTMLAAVTLLPALLGLVRHRINALSLRRRARTATDGADTGWSYRWVRTVQRRPVFWAVASTLLLLVLALPLVSLRLGSADAGNGPTSATSRKAYDMLADGFGPGFNGPLLVVADLARVPGGAAGADGRAVVGELSRGLSADPQIAAVSPPRVNPAGDAAVLTVFARSGPQDEATERLVKRLRGETVPTVLSGTEARAFVGGRTAANIDSAQQIGDRLPLLFAVVIGLSLLVLLVAFRSLVLPIKAAVMNLLAIGAAYGVLVAVFQWGWGIGLLGLSGGAPIESVMPLLMFAIAFGLSMDYEVFLLSRVRENWLRTGDNSRSLALGVGATARVITAAAAIMISVFVAFMLGSDRLIKLFGFALAVPILLDVILIRLILVPSVMQILGRANWYLPKWLDRILPRVEIEAPSHPAPAPVAAQAGAPDSVAAGGVGAGRGHGSP
jgi:RND superfamily putative drug exporter